MFSARMIPLPTPPQSRRSLSPGLRRAPLLLLLCAALPLSMAACSVNIGGGSSPTGPGITVPVQVVTGSTGATLILLPVTIDGHGPYTFALDTGASTSLVDTAIAQKVGLQPAGTPQPIAGVGGSTSSIPVKIQKWHTDQLNLPPVTAASANLFNVRHESKLQGLVGSDVWRQFGAVDINYANETITVPRQITRSTSAPVLGAASHPFAHVAAWREE